MTVRDVFSGQSEGSLLVNAGDVLVVNNGGNVAATTISGGAASLYGAAANTLLTSGTEYIFSGGSETGATIGAGAQQLLLAKQLPPASMAVAVQAGLGNPVQQFVFSTGAGGLSSNL